MTPIVILHDIGNLQCLSATELAAWTHLGAYYPYLVMTIGSVLPSHHSAERLNCAGSRVVIVSKCQ
jgi:hypothetical protein